jgi:hypothetical protein
MISILIVKTASQKLQKIIWNVVIDYGGATWERCVKMIQNAQLRNISTLNALTRVEEDNKLFVLELAYLLSAILMGLGKVLLANVVV